MPDLIMDIVVSAVIILAIIIVVLLFLVIAIHQIPFVGPYFLDKMAAKIMVTGFVDERKRSMRRLLDKGRQLLKHGDWAGAKVQFNAALLLEPNLAKKLTKGYRADLLSELSVKGKTTETWPIRRTLEEN